MIDRFLIWGDHGKPKSGKIKGRCQPPLEVVFENPYMYSETWKKIVDVLNQCASPQFNVDHRAIRDDTNVLANKYKKKLELKKEHQEYPQMSRVN